MKPGGLEVRGSTPGGRTIDSVDRARAALDAYFANGDAVHGSR